jgi:hypothetical protein
MPSEYQGVNRHDHMQYVAAAIGHFAFAHHRRGRTFTRPKKIARLLPRD